MEKRRKSQTQNEKKVATRKRLNADNKHLHRRKKGKLTVLQAQCQIRFEDTYS